MNTDDQFRARISRDIAESIKDLVAVGETVNGEYRITKQIGKGGMGRVFLAEDLTLEREVAIKVIDFPTNDAQKRHDIIERFRREAFAAAKVKSHPNVGIIHAFKE